MAEFTPDTIKLKGKDYLEVAQRVLWLRTEHPDAQIVTELVTHDPEAGYALFKAVISIPGTNGLATGWGAANRKDLTSILAANYVEKAETKAIGRACAGLGYGTLAALHEDGDTLADAPVERKPGRPVAPASLPLPPHADYVTDVLGRHPIKERIGADDMEIIRIAVAALGWGDNDKAAYLRPYGVSKFGALTAADGTEVARDLKAKAAEVQGDIFAEAAP